MPHATTSPAGISAALFAETLARYGPFVETLSASKGLKPGQKSLADLDHFRYVQAPQLFSLAGATKKTMELDDVKSLVEWKLRHGKFRPSLMGLVSSNPAALVQHTVQDALVAYAHSPTTPQAAQPAAALEVLKTLRGIGPATASLLLSVHDAQRVLFFSDEAYYWLCGGGRKTSLKYSRHEYDELAAAAAALMQRLGVGALDVERVAYVLMKEGDSQAVVLGDVPGSKAAPKAKEKSVTGAEKPKKRKVVSAPKGEDEQPVLRRSKRSKTA